jgi:glucosylceramidase
LVVNVTRYWAAGFLAWNLALGPQGGPHRGGCANCTGLVTIGPGQEVTYNAEYYVLASVSRLVRPGAVRVASTSFPLTGSKGGLITTAFRNRDGSIALVVYNLATNSRRFGVQVGTRSFTATVTGGSLTTFSWRGAP